MILTDEHTEIGSFAVSARPVAIAPYFPRSTLFTLCKRNQLGLVYRVQALGEQYRFQRRHRGGLSLGDTR